MLRVRLSSLRNKRVRQSVFQSRLTEKGGLSFQVSLDSLESRSNVNTLQMTLHQWLNKHERQRPISSISRRQFHPVNKAEQEPISYIEIPGTISCIELEMRHDKRGHIVGWMEGEPKADEWDGSKDSRERTLEDHVSRYGWLF